MLPIYTQLLNDLVRERHFYAYLEIGSGYGANYRNVRCSNKTSVDPYFPAHYQMTSDQFFAECALQRMAPFDLIYIDGDNDVRQIQRDMTAAMSLLAHSGIIVVRDIDETPERSDMWNNFRRDCPFRCYLEPIEFGAAMIDSKFLRDTHYIVAVQHSFVDVNANFGHFLSEVMPEVYRFCENHYLLQRPNLVHFYCDTFPQLLKPFTEHPVLPFAHEHRDTVLLHEAPREKRRGLDLLDKVRAKVSDFYLDEGTRVRPEIVTILQRTTTRKFANEETLRYALERRFKLTVKVIDPALLSMGGQMYLAANTRILIGVHGAGLALAVFMKPGTAMIEITPPTYPTWWYKQFADRFGIDYHSLPALNESQMPDRPSVERTPIQAHLPTIFGLVERELFPEKYPLPD